MSTPITEPTLRPIKGYVEVEIDGVRQYQKNDTAQDWQMAFLTQQNADLRSQLDMVDGAFSDFLINGLPSIVEAMMGGI